MKRLIASGLMLAFILSALVIVTPTTTNGQGAGLALPDGSYWQFRVSGCDIALEDSLWTDGQGRPVATQQLVLQGMVSRGGGTFAWLLKKMG